MWPLSSRRPSLARLSSRRGCVPLCAAFLAVLPLGVDGQEVSRWFPEVRPFKSLIAPPREIQFRTSVILAERPTEGTYEGRNFEAEVVVGHQFPVLLLTGDVSSDRAVTLGLEMGVFSRFFLETEQNDQVNTDYRVGMPISFRRGHGRPGLRFDTSALTWGTTTLDVSWRTSSTPTWASRPGMASRRSWRELLRVVDASMWVVTTTSTPTRGSPKGGSDGAVNGIR